MAETRIIPSGKVYRQMFDAQESEEQSVEEEVRGLPDTIMAEKLGSDIIERMMEKKERSHTEAVAQLHQELVMLSAEYESFLTEKGEDFLSKLSTSYENAERLLQRLDNVSDLETFTLQGLHELWESVKQESEERRKWIRELDETLAQREAERTARIAAMLKKYTGTLEKIAFIAIADVHRLIHSEAMMINQAMLANRRALARLFLNLMEKDLQGALSHRHHWEDKLQDWKAIRVHASVNRFKEFMSSPPIRSPEGVQATLDAMRAGQESLSERRSQALRSLSCITPPKCSKAQAAEWYSTLCAVNDQIDSLHVGSITKLRLHYEETWQECLAEVERFKDEVAAYGIPADEIQNVVSNELLPLIGQCQSQSDEQLEAMDRAFEALARQAGALSKALLRFARGAGHLWEVHGAGLQRREQQLQAQLEEVRHTHEQENQRKEAELDIMLDRLRQESSEEALRISLDKTLRFLEEIKAGYINLHKDEVNVVEGYPAMVLKEIQAYSTAVSRFFKVKEIYSQDAQELRRLCPFLNFDSSGRVREKQNRQTRRAEDLSDLSADLFLTEGNDGSHQETSDSQESETFTTSGGNVYSALSFGEQWAEDGEQGPAVSVVELVVFPKSLLAELQREVRVAFFSHLEDWYQTALTNGTGVVEAKKEELKCGLDLRLQLQQSRARRIEVDVHDVRAGELVLHRDRVDRHCEGVQQALNELRTRVQDLQLQQQRLSEEFRTHIHSMEDVFTSAKKSDVLANLCGSLQSHLEKHMAVVQKSQRGFRQEMESRLGGLREANAQFIKSLLLFSEGGNFTPEEVEACQKRLEKMAKRIDSTDEAIMLDMEGTESRCLEQAKEVISMFEDRFQFLTADLKFLEKIQRVLTNTQVQIKSEAAKSNTQKRNLDSIVVQLESVTEGFAKPSPEKKGVTPDDVNALTRSLMQELKKRCQYLNCSLVPSVAVAGPDSPLQGAFAVAARPKSRRQDKPGSPASDSLLQPSRMGVPFSEDTAVSVVQGLLRISKPKSSQEVQVESPDRRPAPVTARLTPAGTPGRRERAGGTPSTPALHRQRRRSAESVSSQSMHRLSRPSRSDKRFQVFGADPEAHTTFNGAINSILWKANDLLLSLAEEFYKKKERRPIARPQHLQETFEQCAEELNKRLLLYQKQAQEYHNGSLQDFRQQLIRTEERLSQVPTLLLSHLGERHLERLSQDTGQIRQNMERVQQESEDRKNKHSGQLRVRLGHPAYEEELESLRVAEESRQRELTTAIQRTKLELQACVRSHGEEFVAALASLTENMLFQMDNLLTIDEVQAGQAEAKQETLTTLIRQKGAGASLGEKQSGPQIQRSSRTWPGVRYFETQEQPHRETASITTAKTTQGHLIAVEMRDTMYQRYRQRYEEELSRAEEDSVAQEKLAARWEQHWRDSMQTLTQLYSEE
ncbi:coiled-coil domain-containing protein 180 [Megalops cyprinoides]|uniref:coiled-coil domain-containing protein 180 n=1 Tax=Megalops cyprinoides TaxID=118141 RepID=UPI001863D527|nr:coiled-coil domain-containing protein 180 [Megalops cyprinoides]